MQVSTTNPRPGTLNAGLLDPKDQRALESLGDHSVWLRPEDTKILLQCRPEHTLPYIAARDRAGNTRRFLYWSKSELARRAGVGSKETLKPLLAKYRSVGLIADVEQGDPGMPHKVFLHRVNAQYRVVLPLAVAWTHSWGKNARGHSPLRFGKDTARVVRAVLVEQLTGQWQLGGLITVNEKSAKEKADKAGVSLSTYRRDWDALVSADPPWFKREQMYREDGGVDVWRVTLDWRLLPPMVTTKEPDTSKLPAPDVTGAAFEQGGNSCMEATGSSDRRGRSSSDPRVGGVLTELNNETDPVRTDPESILPPYPSQPTQTEPAVVRKASKLGGGDDESIRSEESSSSPTSGRHQTTQAQQLSESKLNLSGDVSAPAPDGVVALGVRPSLIWEDWSDLVIAGIIGERNTRRLPLKPHEIPKAVKMLHPFYDKGWDPVPLSAALTKRPGEVENPLAVLRHRLKNLPDEPNTGVDSETQAQIDMMAYRDPSRYAQRTL